MANHPNQKMALWQEKKLRNSNSFRARNIVWELFRDKFKNIKDNEMERQKKNIHVSNAEFPRSI